MADVDLNFLARQLERLLANDEKRAEEMRAVLSYIKRIEAQDLKLEQMLAIIAGMPHRK